MAMTVDHLIDQFEQGQIDRRQLLKGLTLAIGGALAGTTGPAVEAQAQDKGIVPMLTLNHLNIQSRDVKKTVEFYRVVFGATQLTDTRYGSLLAFPGATEKAGLWANITPLTRRPNEYDRSEGTTPGLSHIGVGVNEDPANFPRIAKEVHARFPDLKEPTAPAMKDHPVGPYEAYFFDPNGVAIQILRPEFNATAMVKR
jgi:catechol 2,3-dioxygenase-like lactoylglutathione lyase family enzyme